LPLDRRGAGPARQMMRGGSETATSARSLPRLEPSRRFVCFRSPLRPARSLPSHISSALLAAGRPHAVIQRAALGGEDPRRWPPPPPSLWFAGPDLARLICSWGSIIKRGTEIKLASSVEDAGFPESFTRVQARTLCLNKQEILQTSQAPNGFRYSSVLPICWIHWR
jgi:hypothetical protein